MRASACVVLIVAAALAGGCNDNSLLTSWNGTPDTVTLISASRPQDTGLGSGLDITLVRPVVIEQLGQGSAFDVALTEPVDSGFSLTPSTVLLGQVTRAGIVPTLASTLDAITSAPSDTAVYVQTRSVPVHVGDIVIVRSRRTSCLLTTGSYYAKVQVLATDSSAGTVRMAVVANPNCGDQSLVPNH